NCPWCLNALSGAGQASARFAPASRFPARRPAMLPITLPAKSNATSGQSTLGEGDTTSAAALALGPRGPGHRPVEHLQVRLVRPGFGLVAERRVEHPRAALAAPPGERVVVAHPQFR